jgi:WGR domain.
MLALLTISLEAHNSERNHHRRYEITVGRDLLGDWMVTIGYGRTGQGGQECRYGSSDPAAMQAVVREHLHRRLSAPRRIGCGYRLEILEVAEGFDRNVWFTEELEREFADPVSTRAGAFPERAMEQA